MADAEKIDPEEKDFVLCLIKSTIRYRVFDASVACRVTTETLEDVEPLYRGNRDLDGPWNMGTDVRVINARRVTDYLQSLEKIEITLK